MQYDVVVDPGVTTLSSSCNQLFPGEDIRVAVNDEAMILSGQRVEQRVMLRAGEIAGGSSSEARRSSTCCSCPAAPRASR